MQSTTAQWPTRWRGRDPVCLDLGARFVRRAPVGMVLLAAVIAVSGCGSSETASPAASVMPPPDLSLFPGDQPLEGDGWRLLLGTTALGQRGPTPDRGILAADAQQISQLWTDLGLARFPAVDPAREVVASFGTLGGVGEGCDRVRFRGITVDLVGREIIAHLERIAQPTAGANVCLQMGVPATIVVAIARDRLPAVQVALRAVFDP